MQPSNQPLAPDIADPVTHARLGPRRGMSLAIAAAALGMSESHAALSLRDFGDSLSPIPSTPRRWRGGTCLGRGTRDGQPFTDSSGRTYIRDKKGTIRRVK